MEEIHISGGVLRREGRLLLGKRAASRNAYPGVWDIPGGHVNAGETAEQALVRELGEELGVVPSEWQELAILHAPAMPEGLDVQEVPHDGAPREEVDVLIQHVFLVTAWSGEPRNLQVEEHDAIAWVTAGELSRLELAHAEYIKLFQRAFSAA